MTSAQQHTSEGERRERLIDYLHDKEALLGLDRPGQGSQDRTTTKILLALYEGTLLHKATADFDDEKYWFSAEQICSKITGWESVETPFKNTVKRHLERLSKSGYVLCREHPVTDHDQYAITDAGADYCHDNIPAWKKGLYPAFLVLAKLGKDIINVTKSSTGKRTQPFMTIEEQSLAFEFLKYIFYPEPDLRAQFYGIEIAPSPGILYVKPAWYGNTRYPSNIKSDTYSRTLEIWDRYETYDIRYALHMLKGRNSIHLAGNLRDRFAAKLCEQCTKNLQFLEKKGCLSICGHMAREIAEELFVQGFPIDHQEWSFMLIDPARLRRKEAKIIQGIERIMENEEERRVGLGLLLSESIEMEVAFNFESAVTPKEAILRSREFVHVCLNREEAVETFVSKLGKMEIVHLFKVFENEVSFYIGPWILQRIAKELWDTGAFYKLLMAPWWRDVASSYLPTND